MFNSYTFPRWGSGLNPTGSAFWNPGRASDFNRHYQEFRRRYGIHDFEDSFAVPQNEMDLGWTATDGFEPPWEDEDVFRTEFLDNLKARYAASRQGIHDSWEPNFSVNNGGTDGPWDVPGWDLPQPPRTYSGRCRYNTGNGGRCPENIRNEFSRYCDFHNFAAGGDGLFNTTHRPRRNSVPNLNSRDYYSHFPRWAAATDPRSAAYRAAMEDLRNINLLQRCWGGLNGRYPQRPGIGNNIPDLWPRDPITGGPSGSGGPDLSTRHAAEIYIREIDADNWPFYLKCSVCRRLYDDPVYFWHSDTNQLCICCRGCVSSLCDSPPTYPSSNTPPSWRSTFYPRRHQRQRQLMPTLYPATKVNILRSLFEKHYYAMISTEAPRQICYFCQKPMVNPVVTCPDVPPMYWVLTHGATPPIGVVQHAFCAGCLDTYRFDGGADYARCPFTDNCWSTMDSFPVDQGYVREAQAIAGKAWEKTLQMAA
ncbi:hypothetical protein TWF281_005363 [Arthrobotrys megalospora]